MAACSQSTEKINCSSQDENKSNGTHIDSSDTLKLQSSDTSDNKESNQGIYEHHISITKIGKSSSLSILKTIIFFVLLCSFSVSDFAFISLWISVKCCGSQHSHYSAPIPNQNILILGNSKYCGTQHSDNSARVTKHQEQKLLDSNLVQKETNIASTNQVDTRVL